MKIKNIFWIASIPFLMMGCKKESPLEDLGGSLNNDYRAELRVSLDKRVPLLGDTVEFTASTWQKNDKIKQVAFLKTLVEKFGIIFELDNTSFNTWDATNPVLVVTDTIQNKVSFKTVTSSNKELDNYYVTSSNNYVVDAEFTDFKLIDGAYPASGNNLLLQLSTEAFEILKSQLAYHISVADYAKLFPTAPVTNYTLSGSTRVGISTTGKNYLRENLTKQQLINNGIKQIKKNGRFYATVTVEVTTENGAVTNIANSFESVY